MSWDTAIQLLILFILFILSKFMASCVGDFVNGPGGTGALLNLDHSQMRP